MKRDARFANIDAEDVPTLVHAHAAPDVTAQPPAPPFTWRSAAQLVVITAVGAAPRVIGLGSNPARFAWDEAHYVPAARKYLAGDFNVNGEHPPLGKWIIAASVKLFGNNPAGWRTLPVLFGIATIVLTWWIARRLLGSDAWATVAAGLVSLDGMLITSSRTAILDTFIPALLLGGGLCVATALRRHGRTKISILLLIGGALLGAAVAVKWQAAPVLIGAFVVWVVPEARHPRTWVTAAIGLGALPLLAYMTAQLGHLSASGFDLGEFIKSQKFAIDYHRNYRADNGSDSRAWTWLIMETPSVYAYERWPGHLRKLTNVGNPGLWWTFTAFIPAMVYVWWKKTDAAINVVMFAFATMYLPWLVILRPGFTFYLIPFVPFMALGVTYFTKRLWQSERLAVGNIGKAMSAAIVGLSVFGFILYHPWWMYLAQTTSDCQSLAMLKNWGC